MCSAASHAHALTWKGMVMVRPHVSCGSSPAHLSQHLPVPEPFMRGRRFGVQRQISKWQNRCMHTGCLVVLGSVGGSDMSCRINTLETHTHRAHCCCGHNREQGACVTAAAASMHGKNVQPGPQQNRCGPLQLTCRRGKPPHVCTARAAPNANLGWHLYMQAQTC